MQVSWNKIIEEVRGEGQAYLLAVSGGVDSIFLLEFMAKKAVQPLRVAHFNHHLRDQSQAEEALVREACDRLGVELHVGHGIPDRMRASSSLEAEARNQRYEFFNSIRRPEELLVTAHHANDQLETILLRLMRGYPHNNLRMQKRNGERYRPFLEVPKERIVAQALRRGYRWLEDESNNCLDHERNWVRHTLIPEMQTRRNIMRSIVFTSQKTGEEAAVDEAVTSGPRM